MYEKNECERGSFCAFPFRKFCFYFGVFILNLELKSLLYTDRLENKFPRISVIQFENLSDSYGSLKRYIKVIQLSDTDAIYVHLILVKVAFFLPISKVGKID